MKKVSKSKQAVIEAARKMPPLYHTLPGEKFDYRKSRTLWWLVKQPEVLKFIWECVANSRAVTYNSNTGKWQGIDFVAEKDE